MNAAALRFNIIPIIVAVIGLIAALALGIFIGGGEIINLVVIFGTLVIMLVLAGMRQHIWLLIPLFWGFTGSIYVLPIPFTVRDLVVMFVTAVSFALLALRIYRFRNRWGALDFLVLLNIVQVALAFIAHPVGVRALSSQSVGARPYFNVIIAFIAYFILSNQALTMKMARRLPILILVLEAMTSCVVLAVRLKPSLGFVLGRLYSGFLPQLTSATNGPRVERIAIGTGPTLMNVLCSYFRPLTLLTPLKPFRFLLFILALLLVLLSGFRSQFIALAAVFVIASYFRYGLSEGLTVIGTMFVAIVTLIFINSVHPLPLPMQRTLSFLPGHWDPTAKKDAADSTEWRLQMWQDISKESRYIRDKVMGDGFGFSRAELLAMERQTMRTGEISQEDSLIIGAFHNGPLSTIRFAGVVGLILYLSLLVTLARHAARLIRASEGLDIYPLAMFVGLPLIWEPFNFTFIFGGFDSALPNTIFAVGLIKMIGNTLLQHTGENKVRVRRTQRVPAEQPQLARR